MNADGLRADDDFGSAADNNGPTFRDAQCLPPGFRRIGYQCIFKFSRAQDTISFVPSVCKRFRANTEASLSKDVEHLGSSQTYECYPAAPASDAIGNHLSQGAIRCCLIVERAMRLYVSHGGTAIGGNFDERSHLLEYGIRDCVRRQVQFHAAKIRSIR